MVALHYIILFYYARALAAKGLNDWQTAEPEKSLGKMPILTCLTMRNASRQPRRELYHARVSRGQCQTRVESLLRNRHGDNNTAAAAAAAAASSAVQWTRRCCSTSDGLVSMNIAVYASPVPVSHAVSRWYRSQNSLSTGWLGRLIQLHQLQPASIDEETRYFITIVQHRLLPSSLQRLADSRCMTANSYRPSPLHAVTVICSVSISLLAL